MSLTNKKSNLKIMKTRSFVQYFLCIRCFIYLFFIVDFSITQYNILNKLLIIMIKRIYKAFNTILLQNI